MNIKSIKELIEKKIPFDVALAKEKMKTSEGFIEHLKDVRDQINSLIERLEKAKK